VVPLGIVRQRTVALAILGSLAAGTAMYGGSVFLSQYFQVSRGYSPTEAGLLTIPMMVGILISSILAGRLLSAVGKIKPFLLAGTGLLTVGFAGLGLIDHTTSLIFIGAAMVLVGTGIGMTVQNFILLVQNAVPLREIGSATSTVSFFRSLGGTIGVSVLGAVLANRVTADLSAALHVPAGQSTGSTSALNLQALPPEVQTIVHTVYGDATAHIFLISAAVGVVGIIAALLLKPITLRTTIDLEKKEADSAVAR
jgi:MFS family permease